MSIYVEVCHCSHDRSTHFEGSSTCLGMLCDCEKYTHRDDPKPVKPVPPKPVRGPAVDDDDPVTHPSWCMCSICFTP